MIKHYLTLVLISAFMIGAVVYGFMSGGSPWDARNRKLDQNRLSSLKEVKYAIDNYVSTNKKLPSALSEISSMMYGGKTIKDPETGIEYEYKQIDATSYQLCANFTTDYKENSTRNLSLGYEDPLSKYQKGHHCYDLKTTLIQAYSSPIPLQQTIVNTYSPKPSTFNATPATTCTTQNTLPTIIQGSTQIGCDVQTNGNILLAKSYCKKTGSVDSIPLMVDAYGRSNYYWATLKGLQKGDNVEVVVYSSDNKEIKCTPDLKI